MFRIFGHYMPKGAMLLAVADLLFLGLGAYFFLFSDGMVAPIGPADPNGLGSAEISSMFALIAILSMGATGLYDAQTFLNFRVATVKTFLTIGLMAPIVFTFGEVLSTVPNAKVTFAPDWLIKAVLIWIACFVISRAIFIRLTSVPSLKRRIVVIGSGRFADQIRSMAQRKVDATFSPVVYVAMPLSGRATRRETEPELEQAEVESDLVALVRRNRASEVVVATDDQRGLPVHQLLQCKIAGIAVTDYLTFIERESNRVDLAALRPSWLIYSDGFRTTGWLVTLAKRSFDIIASLAILLLTLPVIIATAVLVPLESEGPILYRQDRVGRYNRIFTLLKFRSMRIDAEALNSPKWADEQDPRITFIGRWIRKVRIDELPQLINVLRGEMSFVGPRPERPQFVGELSQQINFYSERHAVKPGITGWAQINYPYGASVEDAKKKLEYDLYYVKNYTLFLDVLILLSTIRVILFPQGAR